LNDFAAVTALIEHLERSDTPLGCIAEVRIRAGAAYSPEALAQAYEMQVPGTPLEGSRLVVERLPIEGDCPVCGADQPACGEDETGDLPICATCGAPLPAGAARLLRVGVSDRAA